MIEHTRQEKLEALGKVIDTLDILRVECPWDRKQTNESLRTNTIEEAHELADALLLEKVPEIRKELGDVLLHILFYSKIAQEKGQFDIADVANSLNDKLIFRHPHVFGTTKVENAHEVEQNWEQIKLKEKGGNKTVLAGVPNSLPSLIKAQRIQEKAANVGFDWDNADQIWDKFIEESEEFKTEVKNNDLEKMTDELGDILFTVVNLARHFGINADNALERSNIKFINRFNKIENKAIENGKNLKEMSLEEMDNLWNEAKTEE